MGSHSETAKRRQHELVHIGRITIDEKGQERRVKRERKTPCITCEAPVLRLGKRAGQPTLCQGCREKREKTTSRHGLNSGTGRRRTVRELIQDWGRS